MQYAYGILAASMATKQKQSKVRPATKRKPVRQRRTFTERNYEKSYESDGAFFLKLVLCVLLGTIWMKFSTALMIGNIMIVGLPIGMLCGLLLVSRREKLQSDRKIWYAVLVIITIFGYFLPTPIML